MKTKYILKTLVLLLFVFTASAQQGIHYPVSKKVKQVDDYFGVKVKDPYRWLEDDNSEETNEWIKAQNEVTHNYLKKIPYREKIIQRLVELNDHEKYGRPFNV